MSTLTRNRLTNSRLYDDSNIVLSKEEEALIKSWILRSRLVDDPRFPNMGIYQICDTTLGQLVRIYKEKQGITSERLAVEVGISKVMLLNFFGGRNKLNYKILRKIMGSIRKLTVEHLPFKDAPILPQRKKKC